MTDNQLTIADVPGTLPEGWDRQQPQTVTFRHQGREVTIDAAELRRVERKLKGKRMPQKTVVKLAINVQECGRLPGADEVARAAREMYEQAVVTVEEAGGKTQRVREWRVEIEEM